MPYLHAHRGYYKASEMFCIVTLSIIIIISVITIILILNFVLLLLCYVGYCITIATSVLNPMS